MAEELTLSKRFVKALQGPTYDLEKMKALCRELSKMVAIQDILMDVVEQIPLRNIVNGACTPSTFAKQASYLQFLAKLLGEVKDFSRSVADIPDIWETLLGILEQDIYPQPTFVMTQDDQIVFSTMQTEIHVIVNMVYISLLIFLQPKHIEAVIGSCVIQKFIQISESNTPRWKSEVSNLVCMFLQLARYDQSVLKVVDDLNLKERKALMNDFTLQFLHQREEIGDSAFQVEMRKIRGETKKLKSFQNPIAKCSNCGKSSKKLKVCDRCRSAFYCDRKCLKKHWKEHKKVCKKLKEKM